MKKKNKDDYITLGQALKKYNLVATGGEGKTLIINGEVFVDGIIDTRRGRKLYGGEKVRVAEQEVVIVNGHNKP
ncbi:MAG TPA: RNA-binding S4 domain-containing protein [Bacilli bacterium]|nr:RNA-binding S4 domain-containing protein [Bacilli bacterium]